MKPAFRLPAILALAVASLALQSCATGTPTSGSNSTYPSVSGNWQIQTGSGNTTVLPPTLLLFTGALTQNGAAVTGVGTISELLNGTTPVTAPCLLNAPVTLSGTVDTLGNISLTSSGLNAGTASIQLLEPVGSGFAAGTLGLTGGSCPSFSGPALGLLIPGVSGTYQGTVNAISGTINTIQTGSLQLALTQAATANSSGQFPITGTLTFTSASPACTVSSAVTGYISGVGLQLQSATATPYGLPSISVVGASATVTTPQIAATVSINTGSCSANGFQGTLTR